MRCTVPYRKGAPSLYINGATPLSFLGRSPLSMLHCFLPARVPTAPGNDLLPGDFLWIRNAFENTSYEPGAFRPRRGAAAPPRSSPGPEACA